MKQENLEALLLDRALGELPPAVAELLDAHLSLHPDAVRQSETLTDMVQLARRSVSDPANIPMPPLAINGLRRTPRTQLSRIRIMEMLRPAACLALGLASGWLLHRPQLAPPSEPSRAAFSAKPTPSVFLAHATSDAPTPPFWSIARLQASRRGLQHPSAIGECQYRLKWDSSIKMPRIEEKL